MAEKQSLKRGRPKKFSIEDCKKIAAEHGGTLLSPTYVNVIEPIEWQCSKGHRWRAQLSSVKAGSWCPICSNSRKGSRYKGTIEKMQKLAKSYGGRCISTTYITSEKKLEWCCMVGHRWMAIPASVSAGHWCPECYRERRRKK